MQLVRPALLAATALLLGGCFNAAPAEAADDRIAVAMLLPPRSGLSPFSDDAFKLSRWSTAETLVTLDADGNAQPALATAFTQVDPLTWSFYVRKNVTFHDGTALTADHVVTALTAATKATPRPRILDGVELSVRADGDRVLVGTATADPLLPQRLSSPQLSILAPAAYKGTTEGTTKGTVNPIGHGTGPFTLIEANTSTAKLDRYDGYWGDKAKLAGIDVSFVPDGTARAAALRTGTADVVEAVPVSQASLLDQGQVFEVPMPRTNTLYLNTRKGPFKDAAVRAAAREAIQRDPIVTNVYEGRADIATGLLGPALPWAKTRESAAYTEKSDTKPSIVLATFTDRAELPEVAVQLQQQLEATGFTVRQEVREYAQIEADALAGEFDAFILSRATVLDSGDPVAYLYSDFACEGSFNISQLCDPTVDAALKTASETAAGPGRQKAILAAEKLVLETGAAIPLLHERVVQGESGDFTGVERDSRERLLITARTAPK